MIDNKIKKGLGRGLSSLLGDGSQKVETNKIPIKDILRNKFQPRKHFNKTSLEELSNSIKEQGVIQPIVVRPSSSETGKYEIIAGERRWIASQNAGLHEVPVVILNNVDDVKSLEFAIVENVQRQDLNPVEESRGYQKLINDFNYNQEKLSKFIGKSRSYITNTLRLLNLPDEVLKLVEEKKISAGHAKILVGLENALFLAKKIIEKKLSVRQTESLIRTLKNYKGKNKNIKNPNLISLESSIEEKTGIKVFIRNKKNNSGQLTFEYKDLDQLNRLIMVIKANY